MTVADRKTLPDALRALVGTPIASITFVEDYVQIELAGGRMTILEPPSFESDGSSLRFGEPSFANELNACAGALIHDVQADDERVNMSLSNGKTLRINLLEPTGAIETFIYQDACGRMWVAGPH